MGFANVMFTVMSIWLEQVRGVGTGGTVNPGLFVLFIIFTTVLKDGLKIVGLWLDRGKTCSLFSGYYAGELIGSMFYYFFLRGLFDEVKTWTLFFLVQGIHLASEWLAYPLRHTERVYRVSRRLVQRMPECLQPMGQSLLLSSQPDLKPYEWVCFGALDMAVRLYAAIYSVVLYLLGYLWLSLGFNASSFHYFDTIPMSRLRLTVAQLAIMFVTEAVNAVGMDLFFRKQTKSAGAIGRLSLLLEHSYFFIFLTGACLCHGMDVWASYMRSDFCN